MASILHLIGKILDKTLNTNSVHMALFVAHNEIDDLSKTLSLSREASLFLAVFTNLGDSEVLILSDIAKHIGFNTLEIIKYFPFVDELLEKGYIERYRGNDKGYIVPDAVLRALQKNEPYDIFQNYQKNLVKADTIKRKDCFITMQTERMFSELQSFLCLKLLEIYRIDCLKCITTEVLHACCMAGLVQERQNWSFKLPGLQKEISCWWIPRISKANGLVTVSGT